jgi:hypothetical protein
MVHDIIGLGSTKAVHHSANLLYPDAPQAEPPERARRKLMYERSIKRLEIGLQAGLTGQTCDHLVYLWPKHEGPDSGECDTSSIVVLSPRKPTEATNRNARLT